MIVENFGIKRLKIFSKSWKNLFCNNISINTRMVMVLNKMFYSNFVFNYNKDIDLW